MIIIGAGRSGTNMLRNVLSQLDGVVTWPCDEINYIWRHGNRDFPTDELQPSHATPAVASYIRSQFSSLIRSANLDRYPSEERIILEKTCANSLRVPFVDSALPEARYIHIVRDGRDVVSSAIQRWKAPLDIPYLIAKARFVPASDLPYYASRYFINRLVKLTSEESALSVWGPRFEGMSELAKNRSLPEVCAKQWIRCVELATSALKEMPDSKVFYLRYEDFVAEPVTTLESISRFLSINHSPQQLQEACSMVRPNTHGETLALETTHFELAERSMKNTLLAHGYSV